MPEVTKYSSWTDLVDEMHQSLTPTVPNLTKKQVEAMLLSQAQNECFPEEMNALKANRSVPNSSRLSALAPEYDSHTKLIRVGGRLRRLNIVEPDTIHPIVLDPKHPLTALLIKHYDETLFHSGPERVFSEIRRYYWILRGRQAVRKHQWSCMQCRQWRAKPINPRMADLPSSRLHIWQPPFWATGMDCFGPFMVSHSRKTEKRWGIIFKCQTTRCVHIDLLNNLDTDSFLMALRRFISRRGCPYELWSDQGTNFKGGSKELKEAFEDLSPDLKTVLAKHQINFHFNPPNAPHFGGTWEREIRSIKTALRSILGNQSVTEEVLRTVLVEIEGMLNSKPLGYVSSDISDLDPITPNILLMGRRDASLPQAVYAQTDALNLRRWLHSQILADQFWTRFIREYLPTLQLRHKWKQLTDGPKSQTAVLVMDPQQPRGMWPIGKISRLIPSSDGQVRTAEVCLNGKSYIRPVARLVPLQTVSDSSILSS